MSMCMKHHDFGGEILAEQCPDCVIEKLRKKLEVHQALGLPEPGHELIHGLNNGGYRLLGSKEAVEHFKGQYDKLRGDVENLTEALSNMLCAVDHAKRNKLPYPQTEGQIKHARSALKDICTLDVSDAGDSA